MPPTSSRNPDLAGAGRAPNAPRELRATFDQIIDPSHRDALDASDAPCHRVAMVGIGEEGSLGDEVAGSDTLDSQVRTMREWTDKRDYAVRDAIEPSSRIAATKKCLACIQPAVATSFGPEFIQCQHNLDHVT